MRVRGLTAGCIAALASAVVGLAGCDDDSLPIAETQYAVRLHLEPTTGPVGALQVEVDYLGPGDGGWLGTGGQVGCRWFVPATLHACNDKRGGALSCAVVDTGGFTGPTDLAECSFVATTDSLTASDFDVQVVDASAPDLSPTAADVTVSVVAVPPATTTTTDPDNPTPTYSVVFDIAETPAPVGALQIEVTAPEVTGGWAGVGADVDCDWLVEYQLEACNDHGRLGLACAVVNTVGFSGPAALLECRYATFDEIGPDDFSIAVVDASAADMSPLDVNVFVSSVSPR